MKLLKHVLFSTLVVSGLLLQTMTVNSEETVSTTTTGTTTTVAAGSDRIGGGVVVGGVTVDGKNYQQVGIRADIPIGKLGIGIDAQFLIDEQGKIRKEDWNEAKDYLNMLYYIRWDHKGAPFYAKVGALDFTYIGYSNIVNGYSNTIEYPSYKRLGMEMSFKTESVVGELLVNDFKELSNSRPSVVVGTRLGYRPLKKLEFGATVVSDLNQYNGLRDSDGDTYPDVIDKFPNDGDRVTMIDDYKASGISDSAIAELINAGKLDPTTKGSLQPTSKLRSNATVCGLDVGIPIIEGEFLKMDLYSTYSQIIDYGWGVTAPGFRTMLGDYVTLTAEYRTQSKEFLFGYFNQTYELERSQVYNLGGQKVVRTKEDTLKDVTAMDGYLAGASINVFKYIKASAMFQDMKGGGEEKKSLTGDVILNDNAITYLPSVRGYYAQNNVDSLKEWRTPSTIMGFIVKMNMGNASLAINNQYTFVDVNGDGKIEGDNETVKTISVSSTVTF